jgi:predicted metalloprotease
MSFNPNVPLEPGQISDRRIGGRGVALGGGGIGVVLLLIVYTLLGGNPSDLSGVVNGGITTGPESSQLAADCRTGADANAREDCRILGFVNSIQAYWTDEFQRSGLTYQLADTVLYEQGINTGCGAATSAVGPFYCPADKLVYLDLGFFDELQQQYGAEGGPLAQGYVVAHEYGHHVQDLLGILGRQSGDTGEGSTSVRLELQADCYAGVWANHAQSTGYLQKITEDQIAQALDAAAAVGDDRIQEKTQGQVNPEKWTHGSAAERQDWFRRGWTSGNPDDCNTFAASLG